MKHTFNLNLFNLVKTFYLITIIRGYHLSTTRIFKSLNSLNGLLAIMKGCCTTFKNKNVKEPLLFPNKSSDKPILKHIQSKLGFGSFRTGTDDVPIFYIATQKKG